VNNKFLTDPGPQQGESLSWRQRSARDRGDQIIRSAALHTIPLPCARETIFSLAARTQKLNSGSGVSTVGRAMFGCSNAHCYPAVPVGLGRLETISGGVLEATYETVRDRSLLAPFLPLLPSERRAALLAACTTSDGAHAQTRSGLNRFPVTLRLMKFCRGCMQEQLTNGLSYWVTNHQYPGAWVCRAHGQVLEYVDAKEAPAWPLPEDCTQLAVQPQAAVATQLIYLKVQGAIDWMSGRRHVHTAALQVMLRLRLRRAGLVRSELKWRTSESKHVAKLAQGYYANCQAPDVAALNQTDWLATALAEHRHYYPLTWAMALAFTGEVDPACLTSEYEDALARKRDADLFDAHSRSARRQSAPAPLYAAFTTADYKRDAMYASGLSEHEVNSWLRSDPALKKHWEDHLKCRRHQVSVEQIRTYLGANPAARRVDVLRSRNRAYRWLEANDPSRLSKLLPPPFSHLARQQDLGFDLSSSS
jgi:hypothetical protein